MASNVNRVFISGRLTSDPDLRYTQGGTSVAHFRLASNRRWRDRNTDEWREDTTFVDVTAWASRADRVKELLTKGDPVFVEGELRWDEWENAEGEKRSKLRIQMMNFQPIATPEAASANSGSESDNEEDENRPF